MRKCLNLLFVDYSPLLLNSVFQILILKSNVLSSFSAQRWLYLVSLECFSETYYWFCQVLMEEYFQFLVFSLFNFLQKVLLHWRKSLPYFLRMKNGKFELNELSSTCIAWVLEACSLNWDSILFNPFQFWVPVIGLWLLNGWILTSMEDSRHLAVFLSKEVLFITLISLLSPL